MTVNEEDIGTWKKKYPFLEAIIEDCQNLFGIIEEEEARNKGLDNCVTQGYDCTQGESTSWEWYGVKNGTAKILESGSLKSAISREDFDYVITHEHIKTNLFEDDTIRIYNLKRK